MELLNTLAYLMFIASIGYYFITNLQWYSYKIDRVLFHHSKPMWHLIYFIIPFVFYMGMNYLGGYGYIIATVYIPILIWWHRGQDKPLVFTGRVKRFYGLLLLSAVMLAFAVNTLSVLIPLAIAYLLSIFIERMLFLGYQKQAIKRVSQMQELTVIGITASYGKTSIKNYISHILKSKYKTYATPRSVNTLGGVVKDINVDLPSDTQVYIVEMGARAEGDIAEITTLVNPHYVVVGKIGPAHIEYFKSMENIRNTKMEILQTSRLKEAWVHESAHFVEESNIHSFGSDIENIEATLDGTSFCLDGVRYRASILGAFNAMNLAASVKVAKALGISDEQIQHSLSTIEPVAHRLQRIDAGGKILLDDSFNGNIDGMMASFELASTHKGRKVIITPGLMEVDDELNVQVAKKANEVFDLVIVTGELNYAIFRAHIDPEKLLKLESKQDMQDMLAEETHTGDLILFANDAPSFI